MLFAGAIELGLYLRGFEPTVIDSPELWSEQRDRAATLGDEALILVGASRIQLALDLAVLRDETGMEPVQLAIDGGSFIPLLSDLAADERVTGTVLVDYTDHVLLDETADQRAEEWIAQYREQKKVGISPSQLTEAWLRRIAGSRFAAYADGASPASSLLSRILDPDPTRQYLVTYSDRSRAADYSLLVMPAFAFGQALRHIGREGLADTAESWNALAARINDVIATTQPAELGASVRKRIDRVAADIAAIRRRGGNVVFVRFPTSGFVERYDRKMFPAERFWNPFLERVRAEGVSSWEHARLGGYACPDGSHIDTTDREPFTADLVAALGDHLRRGGAK